MGQKVNPIGLRLGITQSASSNWYADRKSFSEFLLGDCRLRNYLNKTYKHQGISKVYIERTSDKAVKVTIHTARPGIIIGRGGLEVEKLRAKLEKIEGRQVFINIKEIKEYATNAKLIADGVAMQLERRVAFRRAVSQAIQRARKMGIKGIKIRISGRLGGHEMARALWEREGRVPLHTLRADIDFGTSEASTSYGQIGVKVWVFRGEIMPEAKKKPGAPVSPKEGE
jgi:small subunit ribosomal protein S3